MPPRLRMAGLLMEVGHNIPASHNSIGISVEICDLSLFSFLDRLVILVSVMDSCIRTLSLPYHFDVLALRPHWALSFLSPNWLIIVW